MNYTKEDLFVTQSGFEKIRQQLIELKDKQTQLAQNLQAAREQGDLSENADYDIAKELLAQNDRKLKKYSYIADNHIVISPPDDLTVARFGAYVRIQQNTDTILEFKIASELEAELDEHTVCFRRPVARAVIGKRPGDTFNIADEPLGTVTHFKLLNVTYHSQLQSKL